MTGEDGVAALVDAVRADPGRRDELLPLLREDAPVYADRGAAAAGRIRAWVLAALGDAGCPPQAADEVLADLRSERDPQVLAGAARAVRGIPEPGDETASALVAALRRLPSADAAVSFDGLRPSWPAAAPTTVVTELAGALEWMGARAAGARGELAELAESHGAGWGPGARRRVEAALAAIPSGTPCCCHAPAGPVVRSLPDAVALGRVALEDQDGAATTFAGFFTGRPSAVAFFYTRCDNPEKCSLTVSRLAGVQRALAAEGLGGRANVAAISYDPGYDLPERLRRYGEDRGFAFGPRGRLFRAPAGHEAIRRHFSLRVGYAGSVVNRHAVELFVLDPAGDAALAWSGRPWEAADVARALAARIS